MPELTPVEESVMQQVVAKEGLNALQIAVHCNIPMHKAGPAIRKLQDAGYLIENVGGKKRANSPTFWYVHPYYRTAFELPPLETVVHPVSARYMLTVHEDLPLQRQYVKEMRQAERAARLEPPKPAQHICPHCHVAHCIPPKRQHRKRLLGQPVDHLSPEMRKRLEAARRDAKLAGG